MTLHDVESAAAPRPAVPDMHRRLVLGAAIAAAALIGFGLIMWIAANWDDLGRYQKFAIVGGVFLAACCAALTHRALRIPGAMVAFCTMGGLFALIGQVYQSGADPWQLFALWAVLGLPLAIAAMHDAVWTPWVVVSFTALPLWSLARTGFSARVLDTPTILTEWGLAALIAAALFGLGTLDRFRGASRWAFRLATLALIAAIAGRTFQGLFTYPDIHLIGMFGLGVLLVILLALSRTRPNEFPLLVAVTLALDIIVISLIARVLFSNGGSGSSGLFLLIGIIAAGIVGLSASALLRFHQAHAVTAAGTATTASTWPVTILSGVGAVLAAVPLLVFYFAMFKDIAEKGIGLYILGALTLAVAIAVLYRAEPLRFRQQLGFILLVVGIAALIAALLRDTSFRTTSLAVLPLTLVLAWMVPSGWIRALLGFSGGFSATVLADEVFGSGSLMRFAVSSVLAWAVVAALSALALLALGAQETSEAATRRPRAIIDRYMRGFSGAALIGLMSATGQSFLMQGITLGAASPVFDVTMPELSIWDYNRITSLLCAGAAIALLLARRAEMRTPLVLIIAAVMVVLSAVSNTLGPATLLLVAALVTGRSVIAGFAAIACLWIVGAFYYWLGWSLTHKAWLLIGSGIALGAAAALSGLRLKTEGSVSGRPSVPRGVAQGLIALTALATTVGAARTIQHKEAIIANGRTVYLALAPVDPRSLMQGDYMALRFAMPASIPQPDGRARKAVATMDARGIATVTRVVDAEASTGPDEIVLALREKQGRWIVGTDAWYFREGTAKTYEKAKFGQFRLGPEGEAILTGMADDSLNALR